MKGVFLDTASVGNDLDFSQLKSSLSQWHFEAAANPQDIISLASDADVIVSNKVPLTRATLTQLPRLKLICVAATGTNNVDLKAAHQLGIPVCNVTNYAADAVAQHVFALLLQLMSNIPAYAEDVRQGKWSQSPFFCMLDHPIEALSGKKLGIIGYGNLGKKVAQIGEAFGMQILIAARPSGPVGEHRMPLQTLLKEADVVSLHCPLTPDTHHLVDAEKLALMKPNAVLINTARGGIVDEQALVSCLCRGHLKGAALDVLPQEPPTPDEKILSDIPKNLIITPHIAWATQKARQNLVNQIASNITSFLSGKCNNLVNA